MVKKDSKHRSGVTAKELMDELMKDPDYAMDYYEGLMQKAKLVIEKLMKS